MRVLVVEDQDDLREVVVETLREEKSGLEGQGVAHGEREGLPVNFQPFVHSNFQSNKLSPHQIAST